MGVALLVGAFVVGGVAYVIIHGGGGINLGGGGKEPGTAPLGKMQQSETLNFSYVFPPAPWRQDKETLAGLQANIAIRRTNPDAWMAVLAKDYKTQNPRDGQAFDDVFKRMEKHFVHLEYEQQADGQLAGQPAMRFIFQAQVKDKGPIAGEGCLAIYQGIAYTLLTWAPAESLAAAQPEFDDLRLRFELLRYRDTWVDTRQPVIHRGSKLAYTVRDNLANWKKNPDYMDLYQADLALEATDPNIPDVKTNTAVVLVMLYPKRDNLAAAALLSRGELEKTHRKEYPDSRFEVLLGKEGPLDREGLVGDQKGHVAKLHVINGENRHRFAVLATVLGPDQTIALHCECPWERRSLWERDFDQLIGTFRLKR
jgi:hypothetical protein